MRVAEWGSERGGALAFAWHLSRGENMALENFGARAPLVALPVLLALLACGEGGKNANQRGVGDEPGGVKLGIGDIGVAPQGGYVIFSNADQLAVAWPDEG